MSKVNMVSVEQTRTNPEKIDGAENMTDFEEGEIVDEDDLEDVSSDDLADPTPKKCVIPPLTYQEYMHKKRMATASRTHKTKKRLPRLEPVLSLSDLSENDDLDHPSVRRKPCAKRHRSSNRLDTSKKEKKRSLSINKHSKKKVVCDGRKRQSAVKIQSHKIHKAVKKPKPVVKTVVVSSSEDENDIRIKRHLKEAITIDKNTTSSLKNRLFKILKPESETSIHKDQSAPDIGLDIPLPPVITTVAPLTEMTKSCPATSGNNDSSDEDPDLLRLRLLALKSKPKISTTLVKACSKEANLSPNPIDDDDQQLRLAALKSAVIKKHEKRIKLQQESKKMDEIGDTRLHVSPVNTAEPRGTEVSVIDIAPSTTDVPVSIDLTQEDSDINHSEYPYSPSDKVFDMNVVEVDTPYSPTQPVESVITEANNNVITISSLSQTLPVEPTEQLTLIPSHNDTPLIQPPSDHIPNIGSTYCFTDLKSALDDCASTYKNKNQRRKVKTRARKNRNPYSPISPALIVRSGILKKTLQPIKKNVQTLNADRVILNCDLSKRANSDMRKTLDVSDKISVSSKVDIDNLSSVAKEDTSTKIQQCTKTGCRKNSEGDEDEDILRAMLLTNLSTKISSNAAVSINSKEQVKSVLHITDVKENMSTVNILNNKKRMAKIDNYKPAAKRTKMTTNNKVINSHAISDEQKISNILTKTKVKRLVIQLRASDSDSDEESPLKTETKINAASVKKHISKVDKDCGGDSTTLTVKQCPVSDTQLQSVKPPTVPTSAFAQKLDEFLKSARSSVETLQTETLNKVPAVVKPQQADVNKVMTSIKPLQTEILNKVKTNTTHTQQAEIVPDHTGFTIPAIVKPMQAERVNKLPNAQPLPAEHVNKVPAIVNPLQAETDKFLPVVKPLLSGTVNKVPANVKPLMLNKKSMNNSKKFVRIEKSTSSPQVSALTRVTPKVVRHLPKSRQQEYRRLVQQMQILECRNAAKKTLHKNSQLKKTITNENALKNIALKKKLVPKLTIAISQNPDIQRSVLTSAAGNTINNDMIGKHITQDCSVRVVNVVPFKREMAPRNELKITNNNSIGYASQAIKSKVASLLESSAKTCAEMSSPTSKLKQIANVTEDNNLAVCTGKYMPQSEDKIGEELSFDMSQMTRVAKLELLDMQETNLVQKRLSYVHQLENMINIISKAEREKEIQIELENEVAELREKLSRAEMTLQQQKARTASMYTSISEARNVVGTGLQECLKIGNACMRIGTNVHGSIYRAPNDGSDLMKNKLCDLAAETNRLAKDAKLRLSENLKNTNRSTSPKCADVDFENQVSIELPQAVESQTVESRVECENYKLENLKDNEPPTDMLGNVLRTNCSKSDKRIANYVSPLMHMLPKNMDCNPDAILCPYDLMGRCEDSACSYRHLPS